MTMYRCLTIVQRHAAGLIRVLEQWSLKMTLDYTNTQIQHFAAHCLVENQPLITGSDHIWNQYKLLPFLLTLENEICLGSRGKHKTVRSLCNLQCRRTLGGQKLLVYSHIAVAAIFDYMTEDD